MSIDRFEVPVTPAPQKRGPFVRLRVIDRLQAGALVPPRFKMIGMDHVTNGLYDTWEVTGVPDYSAAFYSGGLATPLRAVSRIG